MDIFGWSFGFPDSIHSEDLQQVSYLSQSWWHPSQQPLGYRVWQTMPSVIRSHLEWNCAREAQWWTCEARMLHALPAGDGMIG